MNDDSRDPLRFDLSNIEEEPSKGNWDHSDTSASKNSTSRLRLDSGLKQPAPKEAPKKSLFRWRKARALIGPGSVELDHNNQSTVPPEDRRESFGQLVKNRRIVSGMVGNQSQFVMDCPSVIGSACSSSASHSLGSGEGYNMKSIMFDEDMVSVTGGPKKKKLAFVMESQSIDSLSSEEEAGHEIKNSIRLARESSWEIQRQKWTISEASQFYHAWKIVEILLSFATALLYSYEATFVHLQTEEQRGSFEAYDILFQLFFFLSLVIYVLLDEHCHGSTDLKSHGLRIVKQPKFIINVVTLIPFPQLASPFFSPLLCQRLHLVKALRLKYGLEFLDEKKFKKSLHQVQIKIISDKLKNPEFEANAQEDYANMTAIMLTTEVLRTLRLVVIIVFLSFFTGSLWFIFSEYVASSDNNNQRDPLDTDNFIEAFDLDPLENTGVSTKLTYFAFTTLSTVGLGDLHPRNNTERVLCSIVMLFGVMCTSMLMDNFSMMIKRLQDFGKPYDESKQFSLFVGTLQKFNEGDHLCKNFEARMEQYFHYRWSFNRNLAISTEEDVGLYDELPGRLKTELYVDFLFKGFIDKYRVVLDLGQSHFPYKRKYLREVRDKQADISQIDWTRYYTDYTHDDFLVSLLRELEPIQFNYGKLLLRQGQDPVTEVYFPMRGELQFGYNHQKFLSGININDMDIPFDPLTSTYQEVRGRITQNFSQKMSEFKSQHKKKFEFPVVLGPGIPVGLFETVFNKPYQFSVRVTQDEDSTEGDKDKIADCYFIRSSSWRKILETDDGDDKKARLIERFRTNALTTFIRRVYQPIREHKQCFVQSENMMIFKDYDKHRVRNEELYKEIARPLVDGQLLQQVRKQRSRQGSVQLINETRRRTIMMMQGINLIAAGSQGRKSLSNKRSEFESLASVADMVAANTLELHHKPFKQISLLNLQGESPIKEDAGLLSEQDAILLKLREAQQMTRTLTANMRLMQAQLDTIQHQQEEDHLAQVTIAELKTEVASLKAQLYRERKKPPKVGGLGNLEKMAKTGTFFSFTEPYQINLNDVEVPNWSQSQKQEETSSESESSPESLKLDDQGQASASSFQTFNQMVSVMQSQTPQIKSEPAASQALALLNQPLSVFQGAKGPVLGIEINLLGALKQAGLAPPQEERDNTSLKTWTQAESPMTKLDPTPCFSGSAFRSESGVMTHQESTKRSMKQDFSEVLFSLKESAMQISPQGILPNQRSSFSDDYSIKQSIDAGSPLIKEKKKSYGKRFHKLTKANFTKVKSPILEEGNEDQSPKSVWKSRIKKKQPKKEISCSSQEGNDSDDDGSQVGQSQFYNIMGNESSETESCIDIGGIEAQVESECPTGTNQATDQDQSPSTLWGVKVAFEKPMISSTKDA